MRALDPEVANAVWKLRWRACYLPVRTTIPWVVTIPVSPDRVCFPGEY